MGSPRMTPDSLLMLNLMLTVEGIDARRSLTLSLTILEEAQGFLFLLGLPREGQHLPDEFASPDAGVEDSWAWRCSRLPSGCGP